MVEPARRFQRLIACIEINARERITGGLIVIEGRCVSHELSLSKRFLSAPGKLALVKSRQTRNQDSHGGNKPSSIKLCRTETRRGWLILRTSTVTFPLRVRPIE